MSNEKQAQELTGHTPGPWYVESKELNSYTIHSDEIDLATVWGIDIDDAEAYANAQLMAQAPSLKAENERLREANRVMLDALKGAITEMSPVWNFDLRNAPEYVKEMIAAIAIGEGRHGV